MFGISCSQNGKPPYFHSASMKGPILRLTYSP
uniref:Uncharacterized protein n=1 Tax=Arundo donax TaxID=35708 RepID=A0A0A8Z7J3_ARUDO